MDLCQMATYQARETAHSGVLKRGELVVSLRTLGRRWGWSKDRVRRFVSDLSVRTAIATVRETPDGTVYSIVNYDTYAILGDPERDTKRDTKRDRGETAARQEQPLNQGTSTTTTPYSPPRGTAPEPKASKSRKRQLPDDWSPTESHEKKAAELNLHIKDEADAFRDHHLAHGKTMLDWDRAFYTWLRNATKFGSAKQPANGHRTVRGVDGRRYIQ